MTEAHALLRLWESLRFANCEQIEAIKFLGAVSEYKSDRFRRGRELFDEEEEWDWLHVSASLENEEAAP